MRRQLWGATESNTRALANGVLANAWFRNNNDAQRSRLVQGAANPWCFWMMTASIPYNYSYAAYCMLMNEWRFESLTNRVSESVKSSQRERVKGFLRGEAESIFRIYLGDETL